MDADVLLDLIDARSGETSGGPAHLEPPEPRRRWRAAVAFGGAFAAAVIVLGVVVLWEGDEERGVVGEPPATIARSANTTAAPENDEVPDQPAVTSAGPGDTTAVPEPVTISWQPVVVEGADNLHFFVAASDGERVVAIGDTIGEDSPSDWVSTDGLTWEPWEGVDLPQGLVFAGPAGLTALNPEDLSAAEEFGLGSAAAVTPGGPGWIAVGRHELDGRVWVSTDAESWNAVESDVFSDAWLNDVAMGGPGLVAVGTLHGIPDDGEQAGVWVSADGLEWDLVSDAALAEERLLGSVVVNPTDGSLVAFGKKAVWVSEDGYDWTPVHYRDNVVWLSQPPPHADAVWVGDTIVAAGGDVAFSLWASADGGATWIRHDPDDPIFDGQNINALLLHKGRLIAVGGNNRGRINLEPEEDPIQGDPARGVIWVGETE